MVKGTKIKSGLYRFNVTLDTGNFLLVISKLGGVLTPSDYKIAEKHSNYIVVDMKDIDIYLNADVYLIY